MVIRPTNPGVADFLHVNEIELSRDGLRIPTVSIIMSSQYRANGEDLKAANCIDGNKATTCSTYNSGWGDPSPTIRVLYPCPRRITDFGTTVVITNRPGQEGRLKPFTLDLVNADGQVDGGSYPFAEALATYTFTVPRTDVLRLLQNQRSPQIAAENNIHVAICRPVHRENPPNILWPTWRLARK